MKQYVVTEAEFELLLKTLENEKFKGSSHLHSNMTVRANQLIRSKGECTNEFTAVPELEKLMLDECHGTFHYHVYSWIQKMKG
jgi:hypothetical protein